jgi:hypothetical protein
MSDTPGSLARHAASAACLVALCAANASAQAPAASPPQSGFFTRYDFHLSANTLIVDDQQFSWDTRFGGNLDVFDYGRGRASLLADYEAILGDERRLFDPEQSYYFLRVSSSYRAGGSELAVVFHHVSRHLVDRDKSFPIAWNIVGGRLSTQVALGRARVGARVEAGGVVQRSHVDYSWTANVDVQGRRPVSSRAGVFARAYGELFGVDGTIRDRGLQKGGLIEAGLRLEGRAGALELFAGLERRIDADPVDLLPRQWGIAGFRLVGLGR